MGVHVTPPPPCRAIFFPPRNNEVDHLAKIATSLSLPNYEYMPLGDIAIKGGPHPPQQRNGSLRGVTMTYF